MGLQEARYTEQKIATQGKIRTHNTNQIDWIIAIHGLPLYRLSYPGSKPLGPNSGVFVSSKAMPMVISLMSDVKNCQRKILKAIDC